MEHDPWLLFRRSDVKFDGTIVRVRQLSDAWTNPQGAFSAVPNVMSGGVTSCWRSVAPSIARRVWFGRSAMSLLVVIVSRASSEARSKRGANERTTIRAPRDGACPLIEARRGASV